MAKEVVIDPQGVVSRGQTFPVGKPVEDIKPNAAELNAWRRFKQVGDPDAKPAAKKGKPSQGGDTDTNSAEKQSDAN